MARLNSLQSLGDVLEPFDPNYLSDKPYEIPQISSYEKKFFHKVSILEKKLRRNKVPFEWLENWECFRVYKHIGESEYPTYRYVRVNMEENDYSFGTEEEDLVFDGRASVVVDAVVTWVNSKIVKKDTKYWVQPIKYHKGFCPTVCNTLKEAKKQLQFWEDNTNFKWEIVEK